MENERVLFVGLTVASQASEAPELLLGRPRIVLLEREAPRPAGGHVSMSGRGAPRHQGTKARRHQGTKAARQPPRGHQGIGLAQTSYIGAT